MPKAIPPHAARKARRVCTILLFALLVKPATAQAAEQPLEAVEPHMGTLVRIKLFAADEHQARSSFRAAFDRIAQLDAILSDYKPESELNRLCRAPAGRPVAVSEDLFRVLAASQELAVQTGGAFDVTLGPVIRLWRQARKENRLPGAAALQEASTRCGYRKMHLDAQQRAATLDEPGMQLDLGGIAKGYAADAALEILRGRGIRSALVAISGDIVCGDPPPGKRGWKIAADPLPEKVSRNRGTVTSATRKSRGISVDLPARLTVPDFLTPSEPGAGFAPVLELSNAAISTSGDAQQHLDAGGERYSHIIDPATGQGITSGIGVTVIAPRGMQADGLATAVSLLGVERGIKLIDEQPETAALIAVRENGNTRVVESSRFQHFVAAPGAGLQTQGR